LIFNITTRLGIATAALTLALPAFAGVVAVAPYNATSLSWYSFNDVTDLQDAALNISNAQTPPSSLTGSVDMSLPDALGTRKPLIFTDNYRGTPLLNLASLSYETYVVSGTTAAPFLQLGLGYDSSDTTFRGRLSFVPTASVGGALVNDTWQTWDALNAVGGWFFSRPTSFSSETCILGNSDIGTSTCSLSAILSRNSTLSLNAAQGLGLLGVRSNSNAGQQEQSFTDMVTVQVGANAATTYDFTTVTPEPSTVSLFGSALAGLGFLARRRRA
jgi:hypothetical protein